MTKNPVASPGTANGVIAPPVKDLSAKTAGRVMVPDRHAEDGAAGRCGRGARGCA